MVFNVYPLVPIISVIMPYFFKVPKKLAVDLCGIWSCIKKKAASYTPKD